MRRPAGKLRNRVGRVRVRQTLSKAEIDGWYKAIDDIRQARVPKKRMLTWLEPSTAEVAEEFA